MCSDCRGCCQRSLWVGRAVKSQSIHLPTARGYCARFSISLQKTCRSTWSSIIEPKDALILETPSLTVRTVKLHHRVPAVGYIFEEKPGLRHIRRDMIDFHQVPVARIRDIKEGADFVKPDGTVVPNALLTTEADKPLSYAHISDTIYMPGLAERIGPVDLMFHETTYLEQHAAEAKARFHSTACQAAMVARDAGAKALLTGHYSSRYKDEDAFRREAMTIFPHVILNREGLVTDITRL